MVKQDRSGIGVMKVFSFIVFGVILVGGGFAAYHVYGSKVSLFRPAISPEQTLNTARHLVDQGKPQEALAILEPLVGQLRQEPLNQQALMLLARVQKETGSLDKALASMKRAATEFPQAADAVTVKLSYARMLEDADKTGEAVAVYTEVRDSSPPDVRAPAVTALGRQAEKANDLLKAQELYAQATREAKWDSEAWQEASTALGHVNVALIFSPMETPESRKYAVVAHDNLLSIGIKLNTTQGLLTRANRLTDSSPLSIGQQIKYTPKDFRIVIERSKCRIFLLDKDGIFKWYYTGLGMPGHETTLGSYKIGNKEKDPIWHKPGAGPIPAGDPANELGTRWMPLVPALEGLPTDLGIHGTIKPDTVGTFASHGCARMLNAEAEELYDLVVRSTPVDIVEVYAPAEGS